MSWREAVYFAVELWSRDKAYLLHGLVLWRASCHRHPLHSGGGGVVFLMFKWWMADSDDDDICTVPKSK